ncbi:MAG: endolytic transglycosylase MltG [Actinobacteria bacterium]|uniref:Unannotated protein n=1 Tax=freshwater metagenome TaxID=449393 RepID=A0A6J6VQ64_9ZZZZ|nr:endolytic transglycosylase MltG [Actinomycetota bacterium]
MNEGGSVGGAVKRRKVIVIALTLALAVLLLFALLTVSMLGLTAGSGSASKRVVVDVKSGSSVSEIGSQLTSANVVPNAIAFKLYSRITSAGPFQAGKYELNTSQSVPSAIRALSRGPKISYRILALPPGLTIAEIAERVGSLRSMSSAAFLEVVASGSIRSKYQPEGNSSLEGLTWPDTYYISEQEDEAAVLKRIVDRFESEILRMKIDKQASAQGKSVYEITTLASLIQGESRLDEDRPLISGVIANRMRLGMLLQIDATLLYTRGDRGPLTSEDFARPGPYNSYKSLGLPPTPIMTVTAPSLIAALTPAEIPYLYYVLYEKNGKHKFATTYAEHLANIEDARRRGVL